jgi:hypothetical protein
MGREQDCPHLNFPGQRLSVHTAPFLPFHNLRPSDIQIYPSSSKAHILSAMPGKLKFLLSLCLVHLCVFIYIESTGAPHPPIQFSEMLLQSVASEVSRPTEFENETPKTVSEETTLDTFTMTRVSNAVRFENGTNAVAVLSILKNGESLGTARSFTDLLNVMGGSSYPRGAVTLGVLVSDRGYYESVKGEFKQFIKDRGFADGVLVYKEQVGVIICTCMYISSIHAYIRTCIYTVQLHKFIRMYEGMHMSGYVGLHAFI